MYPSPKFFLLILGVSVNFNGRKFHSADIEDRIYFELYKLSLLEIFLLSMIVNGIEMHKRENIFFVKIIRNGGYVLTFSHYIK